MAFDREVLLRGWREILPAMNLADRRSARRILKEKGLLRYEGKRPVIFSDYLDTLKGENKQVK
jgi:hypothetical protein